MHWFLDPIQYHYFDFTGRATRREFWLFTLSLFLVTVGAGMLVALSRETMWAVVGVFWLSILAPAVALQVRRLHDTGRSGWWWLLVFLPYIGGFGLLVLCCLPSHPGDNQYGRSLHINQRT